MPERTLTLRELNRATLARQMLLERQQLPVGEAVERLAGLQAQVAGPPFIGLWSRLKDFTRADLNAALKGRQVVRATFMRSTLQLMSAGDYLQLRLVLLPALERALRAFFGERAKDLDIPPLVAATRKYLQEPHAYGAVRDMLAEVAPDRAPEALAYAVLRTYLPVVQVPNGGKVGYSNAPPYVLAEDWFGKPVVESDDIEPLLHRYLGAFGPASVKDLQTWAGMAGLTARVNAVKDGLTVYRDEAGNELLDLPDQPLPDADTPAPVRFVPDYDNLVLSHTDRSRVLPEQHRTKVLLSAGRVRATFLLDGFVAGTWKVEKAKGVATLLIEPFDKIAKADQAALSEEGERLVRFVEEGAKEYAVTFAS